MNLKQRMIQSVGLAIGLMVMSIVAAVPETSVATSGEIVSLQDDVSIIYGLNNGGKTTLLKLLNAQMDKAARRSIIEDSEFELSLFLPTNRLVVSNRHTKEYNIDEAEAYKTPDWVIKDVTDDIRYKNAYLAQYGIPKD